MKPATISFTFLFLIGGLSMQSSGQPIIDGKRAENLCEIHTITTGDHGHNHAYPTARTWHRDNKRLFYEATGPGPGGSEKKNACYLIAHNVETGEKEYLVATEHPDPEQAAAGLMFDYAPGVDLIAYAGPDSKTIHVKNLDTGISKQVYEEKDGVLGGPLTLSWDGTRIAWWSMIDSRESRWFDEYITVIFTQEIDPISDKTKGEPQIVEAFPRRKLPGWTRRDGPGVHVNHPQINPRNRDHICYAHDMRGAPGEPNVANTRLWQVMADGDHNRYLTRNGATHEVIAPDGKSILFPYMHGVGQVFFDTGKARSIYYNPRCCPGHITISPDGRFVAGDTWNRWADEKGRIYQSIMMFETSTRRCAHLCWFNYSHPHPIFNYDGTRIAFSYSDDVGHTQIAWIDVSGVIANWDQVYQDTGMEAGPGWTVNQDTIEEGEAP